MAVYALWNNKGGVGKSYLTFQIASEYARLHHQKKVLVIDLCPQANSSIMLLGGMARGEMVLDSLSQESPRKTISGYFEDRIRSPYVSTQTGTTYLVNVQEHNRAAPENLYLVPGDEQLEIQASRISRATQPGPSDAWRIVHLWARDLINDIKRAWNREDITVFIDCNPSFTIYTEIAISGSDRLIIPFSADGSSKRAVRSVLALLYGVTRHPGQIQSEFFLNSTNYSMALPGIYFYVGNRLTQMNLRSAEAFRTVVNEIGTEIWNVWQANPNRFSVHPTGTGVPTSRSQFKKMFQYEIVDANTASVVSSALGIPIGGLTAGTKNLLSKDVAVNQSQLDKLKPNITGLVSMIE